MSALVVNRIRLTVPVEEVAVDVERELAPVIRAMAGFERFQVAKVGPQEMVVVITWVSIEAAAAGAAILGPGLFNTWIAPRAESQDRVVGPVLASAG